MLFENSPWWILLCVLAGAFYGLLLYSRGKQFKHPSWGKPINYVLLVLRAGLVSLLCFLVIGPFVKQIKNTVEPPVVVVAIDNSSSVAAVMNSVQLTALKQRIDSTTATLRDLGYTTEIRDFESLIPLDSLDFDYPSTDLDGALRTIASDYEGRNLASVVLFSDGIYNQGSSPTYRPYRFTINTIGLGDTTAQQDVSISNVFYNKIAYQGNKFPLVAEVTSTGLEGENLTVSVRRGSVLLDTRTINLTKRRAVNSVEFLLEADREGMQHYVVTVASQAEEFTTQNNEAHAYVEVIEGKENVLLLAQSPHPDIKALRLAITNNQNYNFTSVILSTDQIAEGQLAGTKFDLVILHQLPGKGSLPKELQPYLESAGAHWYIVGGQTDLIAFNATNDVLEVQSMGNQNDEVGAAYNSDFRGFQLVNDQRATLRKIAALAGSLRRGDPKERSGSRALPAGREGENQQTLVGRGGHGPGQVSGAVSRRNVEMASAGVRARRKHRSLGRTFHQVDSVPIGQRRQATVQGVSHQERIPGQQARCFRDRVIRRSVRRGVWPPRETSDHGRRQHPLQL